jgi:hypothetical protein
LTDIEINKGNLLLREQSTCAQAGNEVCCSLFELINPLREGFNSNLNKMLQVTLENLCNFGGSRQLNHAFYVDNSTLSESSLVLN